MQIVLVLVLAVPMVAALEYSFPSILMYGQLPACATDCKILRTSELNCLPPAAPFSSEEVYRDCLCQSEYLRNLHSNGDICHDVCSDQDDEFIYHYYNSLCGMPHPTHTLTSTLATMATPSPTFMPSTSALSPSANAEAHHEDSNANKTW